jgi:hypothetical protein
MARKASEKKYPGMNLIPFEREDYVRQPRSLSSLQYRMDIIQLRAFACLMEKMEPLVLELLNVYNNNNFDKKLSLFDLPQAKQHIDRDGEFCFTIPMESLGISPGFYKRAKASLDRLVGITVKVPYIDDKGIEREKTTAAFSIDTRADERYVKDFKIGMVRSVLDKMVDIRLGYNDHLKRIAFVTSNVNAVRLYVLTLSNTIRGKRTSFNISLDDFREFFQLYTVVKGKREPKYKRYADLDKRVITPATEELKKLADSGNSDFWIKVDRVGVGEAGNPKMFHISAFYTDLAGNEQKAKERRKEDADMEKYLKNTLRQTPANVRKIKARLLPELRVGFIKETQRISEILGKRNDIENPCSFAWVLLNNWLDEHEPKVEEIKSEPVQMDLFNGAEEEQNTDTPFAPDKDCPEWNQFVKSVRERVGETSFQRWFAYIGFISFSDNTLTVSVPTKIFPEYICENHSEDVSLALNEAFGEDVKLLYEVRK